MFVMQFLAPGTWISFQKLRPPFADYSLCVCDASSKTETTRKFWAVIVERCQREKNILRLELFELQQGLSPESFRGRKVGQRLVKKILHLSFAVQFADVGLAPLIACSIEIRHVGHKNCLARQKHAYVCARRFLGKIPDVPACDRGRRADDDEQN